MRSVAMTSSTKGTRPVHPAAPAEATEVHAGILRLALAVEESRAYWSQVDPDLPVHVHRAIDGGISGLRTPSSPRRHTLVRARTAR